MEMTQRIKRLKQVRNGQDRTTKCKKTETAGKKNLDIDLLNNQINLQGVVIKK